ncbi:TfuA-like protein [Corallococcus exercitus]|uniref:TfuA-like protein n=1 Tax=Corallococcus exercitus TaxID=2316736 RepID=UPI0035D43305
MKRRSDDLVVFLGPSLPEAEARRIAPCTVLPPARQGDVWRALSLKPRALVLVDGVFEAQPSVWHHELLAAMEAGVAVFGGGSMGALRASELAGQGMVGVGRIFGWYRDGVVVDDSEVALLHADAEHGWRPLTVPLVNVRHAAEQARKARVLGRPGAQALVDAAAAVFYQERTWARVREAVEPAWTRPVRDAWDAWFANGVEDLKRLDALECIRSAADFVSQSEPPRPGVRRNPSSLVRRRRLVEDVTRVGPRPVDSGRVMELLRGAPDAAAWAEAGLRRALLAGWARSLGLAATEEEIAAEEAAWWKERGIRVSRREAFLAASGLDGPGLRQLCEARALERLALLNASRLLPDGPSWDEALASEARLGGQWEQAARALAEADEGPDDGG